MSDDNNEISTGDIDTGGGSANLGSMDSGGGNMAGRDLTINNSLESETKRMQEIVNRWLDMMSDLILDKRLVRGGDKAVFTAVRYKTIVAVKSLNAEWNRQIFSFLWDSHLLGEGGLSFAGADLKDVDLAGADLPRADFFNAKLSGANLNEAKLYWADLIMADLSGANLKDAKLKWANLAGANLEGANLEGANLQGANLTSATLPKDFDKETVHFDDETIWP